MKQILLEFKKLQLPLIFTVKINTLLSLDIALETKGTKLFSILRTHFNRHFISL
jgi:hypothetical protein